MEMHPREDVVRSAELDINDMIINRGLTHGEVVRVLSNALGFTGKYMIRDERHPNDPDKPGGIK